MKYVKLLLLPLLLLIGFVNSASYYCISREFAEFQLQCTGDAQMFLSMRTEDGTGNGICYKRSNPYVVSYKYRQGIRGINGILSVSLRDTFAGCQFSHVRFMFPSTNLCYYYEKRTKELNDYMNKTGCEIYRPFYKRYVPLQYRAELDIYDTVQEMGIKSKQPLTLYFDVYFKDSKLKQAKCKIPFKFE